MSRRTLLGVLALLALLGLGLLLLGPGGSGDAPLDRAEHSDGAPAERAEVTLRGSPKEERRDGPPEATPGAADAPAGEARTVLPVELVVEGHAAGDELDPPALLNVSAATDPIDSFASFGEQCVVSSAGLQEVDVTDLLDEMGRLGRAPELSLFADRPGHRGQERTLLVDRRARRLPLVRLTLAKVFEIHGTVVDPEGRPVGGQPIRAYAFEGARPDPSLAGETWVRGGTFALPLQSPGRYLVVASYQAATRAYRDPLHGAVAWGRAETGGEPLALVLDPGRRVAGRLTDGARRAILEARLRWRLDEELLPLQGPEPRAAWTEGEVVCAEGTVDLGDGTFHLCGLAARPYRLTVDHVVGGCLAGESPAWPLAPGATTAALSLPLAYVTLEPDPMALLERLPPVRVVVSPEEGGTERCLHGGDVLLGVPFPASPGAGYRVEVVDLAFERLAVPFEAPESGESKTVRVPLVAASPTGVDVTVRRETGQPYSGWCAFGLRAPGAPASAPPAWTLATHARDGLVHLRGVPAGRWNLHVRPGRSTFGGRPSSWREARVAVVVARGEVETVAVTAQAGAKLAVSVTDAEGHAPGGRIRIHDDRGRAVPARFLVEGGEQGFETSAPAQEGVLPAARLCWLETALEPGTYEIEIVPEGGEPLRRTVEARTGEVATVVVMLGS